VVEELWESARRVRIGTRGASSAALIGKQEEIGHNAGDVLMKQVNLPFEIQQAFDHSLKIKGILQ
jgi:hypothetical protein